MIVRELSTCFCTEQVDECREFYQRFLNGKIVFDCGWYVNLYFEGEGVSIQFMKPHQDGMQTFSGVGIMLNFKVDDVDAEYGKLTEAGLKPVMPLEDHPWGDRGFSVVDPIGNAVYIYTETEPTEEFKQYFTS